MNIPSLRPKKRARIEIVPLIDIMFFLLATFVMVSLSMVKNRGIPVILPAASTSVAQEQKEHVTISVTESGQLYLDKRELTQEDLATELRKMKDANAELRVFINGDENARLGLAIAVLDDAHKLGITKVAFQTRAKSAHEIRPPAASASSFWLCAALAICLHVAGFVFWKAPPAQPIEIEVEGDSVEVSLVESASVATTPEPIPKPTLPEER